MFITAPIIIASVVLLIGLGAACSLPAIKKRVSRSRTSLLPTTQHPTPRTISSNHSEIQDVPDELPETPPRPVTPAGVSVSKNYLHGDIVHTDHEGTSSCCCSSSPKQQTNPKSPSGSLHPTGTSNSSTIPSQELRVRQDVVRVNAVLSGVALGRSRIIVFILQVSTACISWSTD